MTPPDRPPSYRSLDTVDDGGADRDDHGFHVLSVAGRLAPGVGLDAAQAEVDAQRSAISEEVPNYYVDDDGRLETTPLVPMHEATVRRVRATLNLLLGAVGMMLLIACANVANLFLAWWLSRFLEGLVWGIEVTDPATFGATAVALAVTALVAALVPAWQAGRTDPVAALREG